jgi:hypothetical protein
MSLPKHLDGHTNTGYEKTKINVTRTHKVNDHSGENRNSAVPEKGNPSGKYTDKVNYSSRGPVDKDIVNSNCSSENEEQSSPEEHSKGAVEIQNTAIDTTDNALMEKPVETTPDVYLDVPSLKVQEIKLDIEDLNARVALNAELAGLVKINVGVTAGIKKLDLDVKGLDLKAVLKVRLKQVYAIFDRALDAIDTNPDLLKQPAVSSSQTPPEMQKDSTANNINMTKQMTSDLMDKIKNKDNPIETNLSLKKGEERHRFREDG